MQNDILKKLSNAELSKLIANFRQPLESVLNHYLLDILEEVQRRLVIEDKDKCNFEAKKMQKKKSPTHEELVLKYLYPKRK